MRHPSTAQKLPAGALALIAVALAWFLFAPSTLGGSTTYIEADGVSMQPRFHTGDLILVRSRSSYRVGDVVAYRSATLHTIVLHRIVGRQGDRYLFKGDHNDFVDPEHPVQSQLLGASWIRIPGLAQRLGPLRHPAPVGVLIALGALLLGSGSFAKRRRRRGRRPDAGHAVSKPSAVTTSGYAAHWVHGLLLVAGVVLTPLLAFAIVAYARPIASVAPVSHSFKQHGTFSYSADTVWGPAYPQGRATTGDPLFLRLVHSVGVQMAYRFTAPAEHNVSGTTSLEAQIVSSTGWKKTIALQRTERFVGDKAVLTGTLDLSSIPALLQRLEASTSVAASYTLTLRPQVHLRGSVHGQPMHTAFSPTLPFSLTAFELQPDLSAGATGSPLTPSTSGSATGEHMKPNILSLRFFHVSVAEARSIALRGIVTALCALLGIALALGLGRSRRPQVSVGIQARYNRLLVPVAEVLEHSAQIVEVAGIEALAAIAGRYERMILHESDASGDTYSVADDGVIYRYAVPAEPSAPKPEPVATLATAVRPPVEPHRRPRQERRTA